MGRRRTLVKKRRRRINKIRTRRRNINKMIKGRGINDSKPPPPPLPSLQPLPSLPSSRNFLKNILEEITSTDKELQTLITKLLDLGERESIIIDAENKRKVTHQGDDLIYSDKFGSYYGVEISDFKKLVGRI